MSITAHTMPSLQLASIDILDNPEIRSKKLRLDVLRLDKIHTIISGNKWFKLKYYLEEAKTNNKKGIITRGGAFSNHLIATAYACSALGLRSVGVIRGEQTAASPTIKDLLAYGMELHFSPRTVFEKRFEEVCSDNPDLLPVDQGGCGPGGVRGAEEILQLLPVNDYSHILCAVGTGTMLTGILNAAHSWQKVIGVLALKIPNPDLHSFLHYSKEDHPANGAIENDFHFGGYAKKTPELIRFMNNLYQEHFIPTDFVYTGKMFYAAQSLIRRNYFPAGSKILLIHSGGLQGNRGLPNGTLQFK